MRSFACDAVLFDLDGVLVDSTAVVAQTWRGWAEKRGFDAERIIEFAHGRKAAETIRFISPHLDADSEVEELEHAEAENLDGVLEVEGARALLSSQPSNAWTVVAPALAKIEVIRHPGPDGESRFELSVPGGHAG